MQIKNELNKQYNNSFHLMKNIVIVFVMYDVWSLRGY